MYSESNDGSDSLLTMIRRIMESYADGVIDDQKRSIKEIRDAELLYEHLDDVAHELESKVFPGSSFSNLDYGFEFDMGHWENIIAENLEEEERIEWNREGGFVSSASTSEDQRNEDAAIDNLFSQA